jgi:hypothetical protein
MSYILMLDTAGCQVLFCRQEDSTMRSVIPVLIAALLPACASPSWTGGTAESFKADSYQCDLETWRPAGPPAYATPAPGQTLTGLSQSMANLSGAMFERADADRRFDTCLELRGYRKVAR